MPVVVVLAVIWVVGVGLSDGVGDVSRDCDCGGTSSTASSVCGTCAGAGGVGPGLSDDEVDPLSFICEVSSATALSPGWVLDRDDPDSI